MPKPAPPSPPAPAAIDGEPKHQQRQRAERRAKDDAAHQAGHGLAGGQIQRGHKRPAARRPQPAQRARIAGKHIAGKHRQQHGVGRGGELSAIGVKISSRTSHIVPGVATPSRTHRPSGPAPWAAPVMRMLATAMISARKVSAFSAKHAASDEACQQRAGNRRADKAAAIEQHGVQRQRIGQIFTPANKTANQRLSQWRVKAIEHAQAGQTSPPAATG